MNQAHLTIGRIGHSHDRRNRHYWNSADLVDWTVMLMVGRTNRNVRMCEGEKNQNKADSDNEIKELAGQLNKVLESLNNERSKKKSLLEIGNAFSGYLGLGVSIVGVVNSNLPDPPPTEQTCTVMKQQKIDGKTLTELTHNKEKEIKTPNYMDVLSSITVEDLPATISETDLFELLSKFEGSLETIKIPQLMIGDIDSISEYTLQQRSPESYSKSEFISNYPELSFVLIHIFIGMGIMLGAYKMEKYLTHPKKKKK